MHIDTENLECQAKPGKEQTQHRYQLMQEALDSQSTLSSAKQASNYDINDWV